MTTATFRFDLELNGFLRPRLRGREFDYPLARDATAKHTIEALGVPHTEVELILVNGESVGFERLLGDGDQVAVYPSADAFDAIGMKPLHRLRTVPRTMRFVADAHLGGLAHLLRMSGFDTLYDNHFADEEIEAIAQREDRIVLTRDRELLKRRGVAHGAYVHALKPVHQFREVFERYGLVRSAWPFRFCLHCNAPLRQIDRSLAAPRVPPGVLERCARFTTCDVCQRVFWEGSHWRRMRALLDEVLSPRAQSCESQR